MFGYAVGVEKSNTGEYVARYDTYIQYLQLPASVRGAVTTVGGETIALINEQLPDQEKIRACAHEIRHVTRGDLDRDGDIKELER